MDHIWLSRKAAILVLDIVDYHLHSGLLGSYGIVVFAWKTETGIQSPSTYFTTSKAKLYARSIKLLRY